MKAETGNREQHSTVELQQLAVPPVLGPGLPKGVLPADADARAIYCSPGCHLRKLSQSTVGSAFDAPFRTFQWTHHCSFEMADKDT